MPVFTFGPVGARSGQVDTSAQFAFLTPAVADPNLAYVYVYAGQNLSASANIQVGTSGTASASISNTTHVVPIASVSGSGNTIAVASGEWFWARVSAAAF